MKRDEVRRLRAHVRNMSARAASELPSGATRVPAWSRLTLRQAIRGDAGGEKQGPVPTRRPRLARREALASGDRCGTIGLRFAARHPPSLEGERFDMSFRVRAVQIGG